MMPVNEMDINNPDLIITSHKKVSSSHPRLHEYVKLFHVKKYEIQNWDFWNCNKRA